MAIERWRPRRGMARAQQQETTSLGGLSRLERQIDDMFDRFVRDLPMFNLGQAGSGTWAPALDVIDRKDEVVVRADLPGLEQKDVQLEIENNTLSLHGERAEEHEEKEEGYYFAERWEGSFNRSIALPPGVDTEHVDATFKSGVLEVHFPKTHESKGRKVEIKSS